MKCPNCSQDNPANARFCFNCGNSLAKATPHCSNCGSELPAGARSVVEVVSGAERVEEVARLLSGRGTAAALARAGELLREGGTDRGADRVGSAPAGLVP